MSRDRRSFPAKRRTSAGRVAALAVVLAIAAWTVPLTAIPLARPALADGKAALLFSLSVERATPAVSGVAPIHAAGLILRETETGALTRRVAVAGASPDVQRLDTAQVAPLERGALFLLEVPPGRYHPRQFDVRLDPSRGASGPICCPTAVEARAGEITYIGAVTLTVRTTEDGAVGSVTFRLTDQSGRDVTLYETAAPDPRPITRAVAAHPPVTRYIGDGRFRE